jgi:putative peptidoglycan lipid II flippase
LLRITFPYIVFISLVALSAGVLNTWNRFSVPAITPALLNVAFIVGAAFFADHFDPPVLVLAWAVFVGGFLQLAFQIPFLARLGLLPRWRIDWSHPGLRRILLLMAPAAFGVSVSQVSLLLNQIFASFLPTGSVSWLYYADRLMELPAGVLGVAVGTILLPSLSKYHASANVAEYSRLLDWGLRITVLLAVPAAVALAVLALPLIAMLFLYGRFTAEDAWLTRQALVAYSLGLVGMILVKILAPGFYARQNVVTPVKIGIVTLIATQLMNVVLVGPLRHAGLALAIGLGACLNAALLYVQLRRGGIYIPQPGWALFVLKVLAAVAFMAIVLFSSMGEPAWWLGAGWQRKVPALLGLVLLGTAAYAGCLLLFGFRPRDFSRRAAE